MQKHPHLKTAATGIVLFALSACGHVGSSNPILGKWVAKQRGGMEVAAMEFTPTEQIDTLSKTRWPVTYGVNGSEVDVKTESAAMGRTCQINGDAMHCKNPLMGEFDMVRDRK